MLGLGGQYPLDHRFEQLLIDDHRHHAEEDRQQRGEGQCLFKRLAQRMLFGDAGERGGQHDDREADEAYRR